MTSKSLQSNQKWVNIQSKIRALNHKKKLKKEEKSTQGNCQNWKKK